MVVVAGATGLGTRAVDLFFSDPGLTILEAIAANLDNWPLFQAHFVVGGLIRPTRRHARYTELRLRDLRPLDIGLDHYAAIHHAATVQPDNLAWRDRRSL